MSRMFWSFTCVLKTILKPCVSNNCSTMGGLPELAANKPFAGQEATTPYASS
jgi:hypothetical protein